MTLNSIEAEKLLKKDVILSPGYLEKPENRWVKHCLNVGEAAERIAKKLNLDSDFAKSAGYLHDVGRKFNHPQHVIYGYNYLSSIGYEELARYCLTHSFIDNDINLVAGGILPEEAQMQLLPYLESHKCNIYDNIIQLCDLFCLETGFTTIEKRLLDIYNRKGVFSNTPEHFKRAISLKQNIETLMGCELYSLFPEISDKEKASSKADYEQIESLLKEQNVKAII